MTMVDAGTAPTQPCKAGVYKALRVISQVSVKRTGCASGPCERVLRFVVHRSHKTWGRHQQPQRHTTQTNHTIPSDVRVVQNQAGVVDFLRSGLSDRLCCCSFTVGPWCTCCERWAAANATTASASIIPSAITAVIRTVVPTACENVIALKVFHVVEKPVCTYRNDCGHHHDDRGSDPCPAHDHGPCRVHGPHPDHAPCDHY
jgi:hypothetical protein